MIEPDKIILERLDRMDNHLKSTKESMELLSDNSNRISHALIGNEFTGGLGLIHKVKKIGEDVDKNKDEILVLKDNMFLVKWIGGAIFGAVLSMIIYILQAKL